MKKSHTFWVTGCLVALCLGLILYILTNPSAEQKLLKAGVFILEAPRSPAPFELVKQDGTPFTNESFKGQWDLVFFGFTHCPDVCPATLATLKQAWNALDEKLKSTTRIVLVSVDPARDTVEKVRQYTGFFGEPVIGVTGSFTELRKLTHGLSVPFRKVPLAEGEYTVDHSAYIYLINPQGHFQAFFKPPFQSKRLAEKYRETTVYLERLND